MANLLILDASSSLCSVSLLTASGDVHLCEQQPRRHAQRLLPMVDEVLQQAGIDKTALDGIAYGRGPGSFTGIRIAASVMQGIALALALPVFGVSSLQAIAQQLAQQNDQLVPGSQIAVVTDAHMGEVFWGMFQLNEQRLALAINDERVGAPPLCLQQLQDFDGAIAGDGLQLEAFSELAGRDNCYPDIPLQTEAMAPLVHHAWQQQAFGNEEQHAPVYLRDSVAWKKLDEQPSLLKR